MYKVKDSSEMIGFRDSLELNVIEEILKCKDVIEVKQTNCKHGSNEVSDFIKSAIIDSGLNEYGMIPARCFYKVEPLINDEELSKFAVNRYREIEEELYGEKYSSTALRIAQAALSDEVLEIEDTLKFAFYIKDRTSMLIYDDEVFSLKEALTYAWSIEKAALEKRGYKESLCYKICDDVINSNRRFDINERNALIGMAMADYRLNAGIEVSDLELDYIDKKVEVAKVDHPEIETYKKEFDKRKNSNTTVIRYIKKK
jgi:hypothetical protein